MLLSLIEAALETTNFFNLQSVSRSAVHITRAALRTVKWRIFPLVMVQQGQTSSSSQHGRFSQLWTPTLKIPFPTFTIKSIVIAVMGMTGAGKTSFIKHITELDEMEIGHGLKSCTKNIQIATTSIDGYDVHLIDTPGFNDDELKDSDILLEIAKCLKTGVHLSGILYLHPISDGRMGGAGKRNLELLQNLVGPENMRNVKLITTKWCSVTPKESKVRLHDLVSGFWSEMIVNGAQFDRYDGTGEDGKRIVQSILKTAPVTLLFQEELRKGYQLAETSAGKSLMEKFAKLQEKYEREVRELKDGVAAEREKYEEALRKRDEAAEQVRKLHEGRIKEMQGRISELERRRCLVM